jgi:nanoRNase/pAp phosphatase (c-di-AMP/oligoRNAs hydrolase)
VLTELHEWITAACNRGAVPILSHRNGDMDTIGSGIALASSRPELMACGVHIGRMAKRLCDEMKAPFRQLSQNPSWPDKLGGIIIVDSAGPAQTGLNLPEGVPICIIDHHSTSDWEFSDDDFECRLERRSTTQIIHEYLNDFSQESLTDNVRKLLLAGLITDTGRFRHADGQALATAASLMEGAGFEYQSFIEYVEERVTSPSERGAMVKAMARANNIEAGPWNLVHTNASTLEGRVAGALVGLGAEVAMVSRSRDGKTRLTTRASRVSTRQGVHLGEMLQNLAHELGGEGGGHDGAAGLTVTIDRVAAETAFINLLAKTRRDEGES